MYNIGDAVELIYQRSIRSGYLPRTPTAGHESSSFIYTLLDQAKDTGIEPASS